MQALELVSVHIFVQIFIVSLKPHQNDVPTIDPQLLPLQTFAQRNSIAGELHSFLSVIMHRRCAFMVESPKHDRTQEDDKIL